MTPRPKADQARRERVEGVTKTPPNPALQNPANPGLPDLAPAVVEYTSENHAQNVKLDQTVFYRGLLLMRFIFPALLLIFVGACQQPQQKIEEPTVDPKLEEAQQLEKAWKLINPRDGKTECEEGPSVARAYRLAGDVAGARRMEASVKVVCSGVELDKSMGELTGQSF